MWQKGVSYGFLGMGEVLKPEPDTRLSNFQEEVGKGVRTGYVVSIPPLMQSQFLR